MDLRCDSSSRVSALQAQSLEFKPKSHQKKEKNSLLAIWYGLLMVFLTTILISYISLSFKCPDYKLMHHSTIEQLFGHLLCEDDSSLNFYTMNQWFYEPQVIQKISILKQKYLSLLLVILCSIPWKEFHKSLGETSKIKIKTTLLIQGNFTSAYQIISK
jgi:hypothetical protein